MANRDLLKRIGTDMFEEPPALHKKAVLHK